MAYLNAPADKPELARQVIGVCPVSRRDYRTVGYRADLRAKSGRHTPHGARSFELGNGNYMKDSGFGGDPNRYCAADGSDHEPTAIRSGPP